MRMSNALLSVEVLPERGGGLARMDWQARGVAVPVMRPCSTTQHTDTTAWDPNRLACYPLVPWSNRISNGGFSVGDRRVSLSPNRDDEPYPIHGTGWLRPWHVVHADRDRIHLALEDASTQAYAYRAEQRYVLDGATLRIDLEATNLGSLAMPFGLGLHPFFPRRTDTLLQAAAKQVWLSDPRTWLPTSKQPVPEPWNFAELRRLPDDIVNHCFLDWPGRAHILWPETGMRLEIDAEVDRFLLYVPPQQDFFCFEPVDHSVDAVNRPDGAEANGMTWLAPGQRLRRRFAFTVHDDASASLS